MIPERDRIQTVMTTEEIAEALESGDYQAEMLMQHLIRHHNRLERELAVLKATLADPAEVELAMIRGDIAIPHRVEFDGIRDTPTGDNL